MTDAPSPAAKKYLDDSHFTLWRCIIAIVLADGVYHPTERKFLDKAFSALEAAYDVRNEQRKIFSNDLRTAKDIGDLLPQLTNPLHKVLLPYFGDVITLIDGKRDQKEAMFMKNIEDKLRDPASDALYAEIQRAIADGKTQRRFKLVDFLLEKLGIGPLD